MTPDDPRHGTSAGRTQHVKTGEPLCPACRKAYNAYMRKYAKSKRQGCAITSGFVPGKRSGLGWPL